MIGFTRRGRKFPFIWNANDFVRFGSGAGAAWEVEIVYTRCEPDPTTSSDIFTMSEDNSEVHIREQRIVYFIT